MCSDPLADQSPFKVRSARRGFRKGVDPLKLNQLVDELDVGPYAHRNSYACAGSQVASPCQPKMIASLTSRMTINGTMPQ